MNGGHISHSPLPTRLHRSLGRRGSPGLAVIINDATEQQQKTFEVIESERVEALTYWLPVWRMKSVTRSTPTFICS